jgi:hypothetical protein
LDIVLPEDPAIPDLGIYPEDASTYDKDTCYTIIFFKEAKQLTKKKKKKKSQKQPEHFLVKQLEQMSHLIILKLLLVRLDNLIQGNFCCQRKISFLFNLNS